MSTDAILTEAKRKVQGNLCLNVGQGSGGGFTNCGAAGATSARGTSAKHGTRKARLNVNPAAFHLPIKERRDLGRLEQQLAANSDLCKAQPKLCAGNMGIERSKMPQLDGAVATKFLLALQAEGIGVKTKKIRADALQATQTEIDGKKVLGMARSALAGTFPAITSPIIVSRDNHILDGHHRWGGVRVAGGSNRMYVHKVNLTMSELLERASNFKGVTARAFGEMLQMALDNLFEAEKVRKVGGAVYGVFGYDQDTDPEEVEEDDGEEDFEDDDEDEEEGTETDEQCIDRVQEMAGAYLKRRKRVAVPAG